MISALKKFLPFVVAGFGVWLLFIRKPSAAMKPANAPKVDPGNLQQLASTSTPGASRLVSVVPSGSQVGRLMGGSNSVDSSNPGGNASVNFAGAKPFDTHVIRRATKSVKL